ncbi:MULTISPECIES: glycosyltransferase [Hyphomicrobiales]|uniref:glycosyltransferase n=1 Tax=Hyphomicrobiales TaxID=356 RepID=UPI00035EC616|nr:MULTISPECIES: glycosyltransferase [Phyllobacteriaceae]MCX8568727.1 glycosyltransferase [Aminobacter sp. MET-1]
MRIALIVSGAVPCRGYGGTQRQVEWLARELMRRDHQVVVVAGHVTGPASFELRQASTEQQIREAIPADTQLVHCHGPHLELPLPTLNTMHAVGGSLADSDGNWSFVSASHARNHGRQSFVFNGFPVDEYRLSAGKNDRLLFLAGIARASKNLNRAVGLARKYDFGLDIAGGARWMLLTRSQVRRDLVFFKSLSPRYHFHGIVDGDEKLALLGQARAFLNPIAWEEPFGMAPVEAMLCGTPVLATPRGAMPEIVDPETGRLFETDKEFAAALDDVSALAPARCREVAAERFSIARTAHGYLDLYARILDGERLP